MAGRYPLPVKSGGLKNVEVFTTDSRARFIAFLHPEDIERLNALVQRVKTHVINALDTPELPMVQ